uniref:Uncharacterized protein n=1 Tax=Pristionchus pacificus TaxID=54126 RepID=A0A2A6CH34_PRIPA|eukprot:PDM77406.1 hypothetical protein PRIPAC_33136 [Pristionchus pacificus]
MGEKTYSWYFLYFLSPPSRTFVKAPAAASLPDRLPVLYQPGHSHSLLLTKRCFLYIHLLLLSIWSLMLHHIPVCNGRFLRTPLRLLSFLSTSVPCGILQAASLQDSAVQALQDNGDIERGTAPSPVH